MHDERDPFEHRPPVSDETVARLAPAGKAGRDRDGVAVPRIEPAP